MIAAAAIVLAGATYPTGQIRIVTPDSAASAGGASFRKLSACVYGTESKKTNAGYLAFVDFSALTGRYRFDGSDLIFFGRSPRTYCADVVGQRVCKDVVVFQSIPANQVQRIIDDISYLQGHGCPPRSAGDPY